MEAVVRLERSGCTWPSIQEMSIAQIRGRLAVIDELDVRSRQLVRATTAIDLRMAVGSLFDKESAKAFADHIQKLLET